MAPRYRDGPLIKSFDEFTIGPSQPEQPPQVAMLRTTPITAALSALPTCPSVEGQRLLRLLELEGLQCFSHVRHGKLLLQGVPDAISPGHQADDVISNCIVLQQHMLGNNKVVGTLASRIFCSTR